MMIIQLYKEIYCSSLLLPLKRLFSKSHLGCSVLQLAGYSSCCLVLAEIAEALVLALSLVSYI